MRISDWSSDVCSSDLVRGATGARARRPNQPSGAAMKFVIMAGGTGGHVYPALAVAQALRTRGHEVTWMGAPDSFEARVVPQHGFAIDFIHVSGLRGKGVLKLLQIGRAHV